MLKKFNLVILILVIIYFLNVSTENFNIRAMMAAVNAAIKKATAAAVAAAVAARKRAAAPAQKKNTDHCAKTHVLAKRNCEARQKIKKRREELNRELEEIRNRRR